MVRTRLFGMLTSATFAIDDDRTGALICDKRSAITTGLRLRSLEYTALRLNGDGTRDA